MNETGPLRLRFEAYELDEGNARLTREGRPIPLVPKAFALLCTLARQPGQLVTKDALLDAVWGHRHISESVLKTTISALRAALDDDPKQPRIIETASRRGYRFIGAAAAQPAVVQVQSTPLIGRKAALEKMRSAWSIASGGQRQIFWIAGEAGVGKTTLIDNFVSGLGQVDCARGQCVEQTGAGEPYLPVLEALAELCRRDPTLVPLMRSVAPTWLIQLPWLNNEAERDTLQRELAGSSQVRMLRELAELLDRYAQQQPVLLVTEDLHWSDHATVRLIDHIARRRNPARLMWLASFRLAEVISEDHPLKALRHELRLHRLCEEIVLDPFSEREVADYMDRRFPAAGIPEEFVRTLHNHTDGLPLFLVNVIDDLIAQGALHAGEAGPLHDARIAGLKVPENLAGIIEKQVVRLSAELRTLLEAASVCGVEFRPGTVADALEREPAWVSERCEELVRQQHWLSGAAIDRRPDGTLDARYSFRHALYRNVFYQRIGALTRAQLHRSVAQSLASNHGAPAAPAELALHYERSHEVPAALRHYAQAASNALRQFAPTEAVSLTAHALELLSQCPESQERLRLELALVTPRAAACTQLMGVASPEAKAAFERASALCELLPDTSARAMELSGLGWVHFSRGEFTQAHALGLRIHALSRNQGNPLLEVAACNLLGGTLTHQGKLTDGRDWLERGLGVFAGVEKKAAEYPTVIDLGVSTRARLAHVLSQLGCVEQARAEIDATLARVEALRQPFARMMAQFYAGAVEVRFDDVPRVRSIADAMRKTVADNSFVQGDPLWRWLQGWALAQQGEVEAGYALLLEGYELHIRVNMLSGAPSVLAHAALIALKAGRPGDAAKHVADGITLADKTGERLFLPDLMLAQARIANAEGDTGTARAAIRSALAEARAQQAGWPELESQVALCELDGASRDDFGALKALCSGRKEGRDTPLFRRALQLTA